LHLDLYVILAGFLVGAVVGMTGMGGGALMTPILVLLFGVQPLAAVSSDLVASMVMRPVGGIVHLRRGTVRKDLVKWLVIGSVPAAFAGVFVLRALGDSAQMQERLKLILGIVLVLAAVTIVVKAALQARSRRIHHVRGPAHVAHARLRIRPVPTIAVGVIGGLVVGMTSVGSGSLIIVSLMLMYPAITASELVGTDLVQGVPLVASAAVAHILFGNFELGLTTSLILGSVPGVYLGARFSSRAPDGVVRPVLVLVLLASGLKLVGVSTPVLGWGLLALVFVGLPVWGVLDAMQWRKEHWERAGRSRSAWIRAQAAGAFFLVGAPASIAYFTRTRPRLAAVAEPGDGAS
jgi:uncharacterized membrane protein YfcA